MTCIILKVVIGLQQKVLEKMKFCCATNRRKPKSQFNRVGKFKIYKLCKL